jgi:hypothetical protein
MYALDHSSKIVAEPQKRVSNQFTAETVQARQVHTRSSKITVSVMKMASGRGRAEAAHVLVRAAHMSQQLLHQEIAFG